MLACAARVGAHWQKAEAGMREQSIAIWLRGIGHRIKAEYPAALAAYREALDFQRAFDPESEDVTSTLNSIAKVEQLSGDLDASERHSREALRIAKKIGYRWGIASFTSNLTALALERGEWSEAEHLAREALEGSESVGHRELIGECRLGLAKALAR